jgi:hypothetical protein
MTRGAKRFWGGVGTALVVAVILGPIAYLQANRIGDKTPKVTGPYVMRGMFIVQTAGADSAGGYRFQAEDGRKYSFYCDPVTRGRGLSLNTCLAYRDGAPAPDLGGRPLEVRYIAAEYPSDWLGATEPHLIMTSVRENGRVVFRNTVWMKSAP